MAQNCVATRRCVEGLPVILWLRTEPIDSLITRACLHFRSLFENTQFHSPPYTASEHRRRCYRSKVGFIPRLFRFTEIQYMNHFWASRSRLITVHTRAP